MNLTILSYESFQEYSDFDKLGRCGRAFCNLGIDTIANGPRENISNVHPSGWQQKNIGNDIIDGYYLYNRCHLIAYILSGENTNERNLITGTRYMNVEGMEPIELEIYNYIRNNPNNHVLYRVTPIFEENNLLATGVLMEAYSVKDFGKGILFNVFCYNEQPGMIIDYEYGDAELDPYITYVANENTKKFHYLSCQLARNIRNKRYLRIPREEIIIQNYTPCKLCNP